jgi:hypothetical protein
MSSARVGHGHHRWPCVPTQSGGRSRHASCAGAEWGWWRGRRRCRCRSRLVCSSSAEHGAPEVAAAASRPPPRHWPRPSTRPRRSSESRRSDASKTRRRDWCRGTLRSPRWISGCPGNPPSPHQFRPSARRRQSVTGEGHNPGCPVGSAECASWW